MKIEELILLEINDLILKKKLQKNEIARYSGHNRPKVDRILNGTSNGIDLRFLIGVSKALGRDVRSWFTSKYTGEEELSMVQEPSMEYNLIRDKRTKDLENQLQDKEKIIKLLESIIKD